MKHPSEDSDYYSKYDLERDPFPIHTIDDFFYLTPEFSRRLELIKDLVANSQKVVVVTSSPGAGKTIMAHHLESVNEPNWKVNLVRANAGMDIDALADAFIQQIFPEKYDDTRQVVSQLHKYLELVAHEEKVPVLIIDDAHTLPIETLEFILQLAALRYGESLFRFTLFADVSINDQLEDPKLKDLTTDVLHNISISPFSEEQTRAYIKQRLSSCGEIDEAIFTDEVISHIFEISGGLPRGVNLLARNVMQDADAKKVSQVKYARSAVVLGIIVILTVTVYIQIFINQRTDELTDVVTIPVPPEQPSLMTEPIVTEQTASQEQPITQLEEYSEPEIEDQPVDDEINSLVSPDTFTEGDLVVGESEPEGMESIEEAPVLIEESPAEEPEAVVSEAVSEVVESYEEIPVSTEEMPMEEAEAVVSETVSEVVESYEEIPVSTEEMPAEEAEAVVSETVSETVESLEEEQIAPAMVPAEGEEEKITSITEQQEPESECNEVNIYHLEQIPDFISCIKGPDWFRQQPSKSYVLQLISSRDVDSVEKLLSSQTMDREQLSGYTNYTPSGKPRYLLYYGNYPDNKTAKAAIQTLPPVLVAQKPWPRPMSSIVEELDNLAVRGY